MDETPAYERREGEPDLWYDRFERFRLAGPARSLLSIYNAERAKEQQEPARDIPGAWKDAAEAWQWRTRAAAWDAAEQQKRRDAYDAEREEDHEARVTLLKLAHAKLFHAVNALDPKQMRASDVIDGIQMVVRELRAEYDDLPTQPIDFASLSDEELRAIARPRR
ncbi:MAG TPA: hypothetical protein PKK15_07600 [Kouleothrix sp.]|nr:hypothetical protein [Kouleothrix sp.]